MDVTKGNHGNISQDSQSVGEDLNQRPSEYEAAMPTTWLQGLLYEVDMSDGYLLMFGYSVKLY